MKKMVLRSSASAKTAIKRSNDGVDTSDVSILVTGGSNEEDTSNIPMPATHNMSEDVEFSDMDTVCDDELLPGAVLENTGTSSDLDFKSSTINNLHQASHISESITLDEVDKELMEWNNTEINTKLMKASNTKRKQSDKKKSNLKSPKALDKNLTRKGKRKRKSDKTLPQKHSNNTKLTRITWVNDQIHCYICEYETGVEKILGSDTYFYSHVVSTHGEKDTENRQVIRCPICGIYTVQIQEAKDDKFPGNFHFQIPKHMQHMVNAHQWTVPEYVRTFPCNQPGCSYIAVTSRNLRCHQQQCHEKSQCDRCGLVIATSAMRRHHESCVPERKFKCNICSKAMKRKSHLSHHMKTVHSNEKDAVCYVCSSVVKSEHGLHYHLFIKHGITEGRPIIYCDQCEFQTICAVRLKSHIQTNHSEPVVLPCPKCGAVFKRNGKETLNYFHQSVSFKAIFPFC